MTPAQKDRITGAILTTVGGLVFCSLVIGEGLRNLSYEIPFRFRGAVEVTNVAIVYMDEVSHRRCQQPFDSPWSRALHGAMVDRLAGWGAQAVVLDVHFGGAGDTNEDAVLIEAAARFGRVVVAAYPTVSESKVGPPVWTLATPFPALEEVAPWGGVEVTWGEDFVRRHYQGRFGEVSLAWRVAEMTMANPPSSAPERTRWVNYYGPPLAIEHCSYWQVLSNALPDAVALFSNKVVFVGSHVGVGYTAGRPTEYFRTPYYYRSGQLSPGVEVNATTYLNLWRRDWLTETPTWVELFVTVLGGLGFGYGLAGLRLLPAFLVSCLAMILLAGAATLIMGVWHIWTPWLILAGVEIPCALGWSVLASTRRLSFEQEKLKRQLAQVRPGAAVLTPGLGSERTRVLPRSASLYVAAGPVPGVDSDKLVPAIPDHTLLSCIGQGAYGQVWLARDVIGSHHAVKVVYRKSFHSSSPFEREFRGIQKFTPISRSHPGLVNILHVGINNESGYFCCVMEVGDDETTGQQIDPARYTPKSLAQELRRRGRLPVATCLQLGLDLAGALGYLHGQGLIHRDLKPPNIIFVHNAPKLADVGLVTEVAADGHDVSYVGTEGYMAPEGPGTPAADVYSLGKVLYEASSGFDRRRFPELPTALMEDTHPRALFQLNRIILRACETDPARRYPTAAALAEDLLQLKTQGSRPRRSWLKRWLTHPLSGK